MTHGRVQRSLTTLAIAGVLGYSLSIMPVYAQDDATQSDSSSADASTQSGPSADQADANSTKSDRQRRLTKKSTSRSQASQDSSVQNPPDSQYPKRSQRQSQYQNARGPFDQNQGYQNQPYQGQPYEGQFFPGQPNPNQGPAFNPNQRSYRGQDDNQIRPYFQVQPYFPNAVGPGRDQFDRSASADQNRQAFDRSRDGRNERRQDAADNDAGNDNGGDNNMADNDAAWLGIYLSRGQDSQNGAQVAQVYPAGPAARAGLRPGDVIAAVNDQEIDSATDLLETIEQQQPGSQALLTVLRNKQRIELPIRLGSRRDFAWYGGTSAPWSGDPQSNQQGVPQDGQQGGQVASNRQIGPQEDYGSKALPFAMQLEHGRRMYEQHQRIEMQIAVLQAEVRQLRDAILQLQR